MKDNRVTQRLQSGVIIRQDFRESARWLLFETGIPEHPLWTHGGTAFVINLDNRVLALTARHACGKQWPKVVLTNTRSGNRYVSVKMAFRADRDSAWGHARESDIEDVNVIEFFEDGDASFFRDAAYKIDEGTTCTSRHDDKLVVYGVLYDGSTISETLSPAYCELELADAGQQYTDGRPISDPILRRATGALQKRPELTSLVGLSGAPVFNVSQQRLCGMALRATMTDNSGTLYYADIADVLKFACAVRHGEGHVQYTRSRTP